MATRKIYDAAVAVREYQTNSGETKKQWQNVGAVLQFDDGGMCLILDKHFNPAGIPGDGGVRVSFFEPRPRDGQAGPQPAPPPAPAPQRQASAAAPAPAAFDDDSEIPF